MRTYGTARLTEHEFGRGRRRKAWLLKVEPHVAMRLKRVLPRVSPVADSNEIAIASNPEVCRELLWFTQRFPLEISPVGALIAGAEEHKQRELLVRQVIDGSVRSVRDFELAVPPRDYQKVAAEMFLRSRRMLCADDLGLGKTVTAITALTDKETRPAVVVTLTSLPRQWKAMINRFAPGLRVHLCASGKPDDLLKRYRGRFPDVVVLNYAKLVGWSDYLQPFARTVIFDEAQELRTGDGTDRYKAATQLSHSAVFCLGLTATPVYNYGGEMFNVIDAIAPDSLGSKQEFIQAWCSGVANAMGEAKKVTDPRAFGIYMREQGLMLRRTRAEVGRELPPLTRIPHEVDADTGALDKVASAAAELAKIILRGGKEAERGERWRASEELSWKVRMATGVAKAPYVADFVRILVENGEKVLLFGWHREVYGIWQERLALYRPVLYTGTESPRQKALAIEEFTRGQSKVLIMSLRSGAGVDGLQGHTRTVAFGELDWSPEVHNQCMGRPHRDGATDPVTAYFLYANSGSDPVVMDVLGLKREQAELIRDPTRDVVEQLAQDNTGHVRRLAEHFLKSRGIGLPEVG